MNVVNCMLSWPCILHILTCSMSTYWLQCHKDVNNRRKLIFHYIIICICILHLMVTWESKYVLWNKPFDIAWLTTSVVYWSEFLAADLLVQGSIPSATTFSEKWWVWNGGPLSLMRITEELLGWKSSGLQSTEPRLMVIGIHCAHYKTPSTRKSRH
jgi:hypothetical protein